MSVVAGEPWEGEDGGAGPGEAIGGPSFTEVPPELRAAVARLTADEPDHGDPDVTFTQHPAPARPLSLRGMVLERRRLALVSLAFVVVEAVGFQTGPFLTQVGIDRGLLGEPRSMRVVAACALVYVVSVVATTAVERLRIHRTGLLAAQAVRDVRTRVYAHLLRLSTDFYTEERAGVIMTRLTSDVEVLQQTLQDGLALFAVQGLTMVVVTVVLFAYNWQLALITVGLVLPTMLIATWWFRSASQRAYLRVRDGLAAVISDVAEGLSGVRVVASYNRHRRNVVRHHDVLLEYRAANFQTARVAAAYSTGTDAIGLLGQLALLLIGGTMVLQSWHPVAGGGLAPDADPQLTIGELTAFVLYLGAFFQPIQQLVQFFNTYQQARASIVKLRALLATTPTVVERPDAYDLPPVAGALRLEGVSFSYGGDQVVLHDVDLSIAVGESVAFVGATGAGKSTIAKLVPRFHDPTRGRVTIDGHDLADVTLLSLRRQLGVVPQEAFLFTGTLRDNVAFGRPEASDAQVLEAIRAVGLDEVVQRLPQGLDTIVHERGQSLASGERQLVALARAFVAGPRVLVLDEATSNLDLTSELRVQAALDRLLAGRTAILVAHRLTTAMRADRIVVIDAGRVVEVGSHDELIEACGQYHAMFEAWAHSAGAAPTTVTPVRPADTTPA